MVEIGGEFELSSARKGCNNFRLESLFKYTQYAISGRTGFELIAREIKTIYNVKSIALPAYCCASMVYPFYANGIKIIFYPVLFETEDINKNTDIQDIIKASDAVLVMNYFGFVRQLANQLSALSKKLGKLVIIDATQTAFSKSNIYENADYMLISYRKWSDALCATVCSNRKFSVLPPNEIYDNYINIWRKAAFLKRQYLNDEIADKKEYLDLYKKANTMLSERYINFSTHENEVNILQNIDTDFLINRRRENANFLIEQLKKYNVNLMFDSMKENDCPLHVPILVDKNKRDVIRKKLIENNVFCPAHWPIDEKYPYSKTELHNSEISLICDQRYGIDDMQRQICELIKVL